MSTPFYYADANAQPVGPLSLDEIRRFVAAGVIPPDVLVCEADGENWRPLTDFAGPPRTAPPRTGPTPMARPVSAVVDPGQGADRLGLYFNLAVVALAVGFIFEAIVIDAERRHGADTPLALHLWSGVAWFGVLGAEAFLLYRLCRSLPSSVRFTSPGRAAGLLLVPIFHLYWVFRLFPGLATAALRWKERVSGERLTSGLVSYGYLVAAIFSVVFFVALMRGMLALPTGVLGHLLVVADFGIRFSFYAVLITQIQGIAFPDAEGGTTGAKLRRPLVRSLLWPVLAGFTLLLLRLLVPS
jgi:hypothetical protein